MWKIQYEYFTNTAYSLFSVRHGKTTLLRHIALRKIPIPANIDVLYCEQGEPYIILRIRTCAHTPLDYVILLLVAEIEAQDEKSAVQVVMESDKKRAELLAQSAKLNEKLEKQEGSIEASLEKLRLVCLLS